MYWKLSFGSLTFKYLRMTWDFLNPMTSLNVELFFQKDKYTYFLGLKKNSETKKNIPYPVIQREKIPYTAGDTESIGVCVE